MRIIRPVVVLVLALSLAAAALTYLQRNSWEDRIYVHGQRPPSPNRHPYNHLSFSGNANRAAHRAAPAGSDPYHQRYYSESEGWTYYTLPAYGSGQKSGNQ